MERTNKPVSVVTVKDTIDAMKKSTQMETFETSLKLLQTDYLDLYLIHWPNSPMPVPLNLS